MSLAPRIDKLERNLIINGNMRYAQRRLQIQNSTPGAGSISFGTQEYTTLDRYKLAWNATVDGSYSQGRFEDAPLADPTLRWCMDFRGNTVAATRWGFSHFIEDVLARKAAGKTVTLSFWYKFLNGTINTSSSASYLRVAYSNARNTAGSGVTTILTVPVDGNFIRDNTWRRFSISVDIPLAAGLGLIVEMRNEFAGAANITDRITGLSLIVGEDKVPDEFVFASEDEIAELELCQRYFEKSYDLDTSIRTSTGDGMFFVPSNSDAVNATASGTVSFLVQKRVVPSMTSYDLVGNVDRFRAGATDNLTPASGAVVTSPTVKTWQYDFTPPVTGSNRYRWHWTADAEIN